MVALQKFCPCPNPLDPCMQPYVEGVFVDVLLGLLNCGPWSCPEADLHGGHVKIGQRQEGQLKAGNLSQVGRGRKVSAGASEGPRPCWTLILDLCRAMGEWFLLSQSFGCDHLLRWPWTLTWLTLTEHALAGACQL